LECRTKQVLDLLRYAAEEQCGISSSKEEPTRQERKVQLKRKKALVAVTQLLNRQQSSTSAMDTLYQPMAELLQERAVMRMKWKHREHDTVFSTLPQTYQPLLVPFVFSAASNTVGTSSIPEELNTESRTLLQLGKAFTSRSKYNLPNNDEKPKRTSLVENSKAQHTNQTGTITSTVENSKSKRRKRSKSRFSFKRK